MNRHGILFTPEEAASLTLAEIEYRSKFMERVGVRTGIRTVDQYVIPFMPGDLVTILARPSNGKTAIAQYIARTQAKHLLDTGQNDKVVVYATWEQTVETNVLYELSATAQLNSTALARGEVDFDEIKPKLLYAAKERSRLPLMLIGHSTLRRQQRPNLTLETVSEEIAMMDQGIGTPGGRPLRPSLIVLDYLQRFTNDKMDRRIFMMRSVDAAKDLALAMGAPVLLLCQADRSVDDRSIKLPRSRDGQETSNIEQSSDCMLGLCYPIKSEVRGAELDINNTQYVVDDHLLLIGVIKQKMGPSGAVIPVHFTPTRNMFTPWVQTAHYQR